MTALPAKETFACPFFIDKVLWLRQVTGGDTAKEPRSWHFSATRQRPTHRADDDFNRLGIRRLSIRPTARILHPVTSGYSESWKIS
jgi:hypothetical protein